jgi:uncharacterized membrane protein
MKRAAKAFANVIATLALTFAILRLLFNLPAASNALDAFFNMSLWDWIFDKFNVYGAEDQEDIIFDVITLLGLLVSVGIVYAANRFFKRKKVSPKAQ